MSIQLSIFLLTLISVEQNNMDFPAKNGKIVNPSPYADRWSKQILIAPTDDLFVRCCFSGKITSVKKDDYGYSIAVVFDSLVAIYGMVDSVTAKAKKAVAKGDIIGMKIRSSVIVNCVDFVWWLLIVL